ncbi:Gfo/Idh/MocA family oxidoreductase [Ktedonosporobacter rubrisoli]|uniref:Gfo/Idh/MocA family oxidoreductase n=1 Tax=Ktedonosporobacter rubrisoli TaxID=2509675 RepID=A0A4P6K409_KTERU|nr:Gfo/Idh/MocA family oxidoreductase [Ktedonosporobacter rubrisoli]QBD82702.1 Gfo/Idh/MocA family oxidoreductase [Ktedonosporobacter rubrisoli]
MATNTKTQVGIIGCGQISSIYFNAPQIFDVLNIVACADIDMERARAQAERFHIPKACSVEELLADPEIEIVINLTIPKVHAEIGMAAIEAGKSVYGEKPLAIELEQGQALLEAARKSNLRVGSAPDTFLGGGLQTCIKLINDGAIGVPIAAHAAMMNHGPENWHPDPDFFYQPGAGPLFDMGPYYLTALIAMMGPVKRVTSSTRITFPERTITSTPKYGNVIKVNTPTHVAGILDFANGAVATLTMSFDVWSNHLPRIEVYGTEGTLTIPDPNTFGGPVYLQRAQERQQSEIPLTHGYTENSRGIGVADMAYALRSGRTHRANGEMAYHVLDIMQALYAAAEAGTRVELESTCEQPAPLQADEHPWAEEGQDD